MKHCPKCGNPAPICPEVSENAMYAQCPSQAREAKPEPTPLCTPDAFKGILDAITSNAARDRKQAGGK